jgi:hypothetical protein
MAIKNINTIQHQADLEYIKDKSNEYLLQSLANAGQRLGIQGDGVKLTSIKFSEILPNGDKYNSANYVGYIKRNDKTFTVGLKDRNTLSIVDTENVSVNIPIGYIISSDEFTIDAYDIIKYGKNGKIYYDGNYYSTLLQGVDSSNNIVEIVCDQFNKNSNIIESGIRIKDIDNSGVPSLIYIKRTIDNRYNVLICSNFSKSTLNECYLIINEICNNNISPEYIFNRLTSGHTRKFVAETNVITAVYTSNNTFELSGYDEVKYPDLSKNIGYFIYDLTYLYRYLKSYYSEILFKDNNLLLKQQIFTHITNMVLSQTSEDEVIIPLDYVLNYACNDNDEWQIYYTTTDVIVRYMPGDFLPTYINDIYNESTWLCHTNMEEFVSLFNMSVNYDNENNKNVCDINVYKHYTLPYINSDGYWVLNGVVSDIYARGKDAGQPNIIIVNSSSHGFKIVSGANRDILESLDWIQTTAYVEPLERTNLNNLTLETQFDWIKVKYYIPDLENIPEQKQDEWLNLLDNALIINIADINCVDASNNTNYSIKDIKNIYGEYGVITTIWNITSNGTSGKCDYLRRSDNEKCAADFNYITNMNNIVNWAIRTHEPKHPDKYTFTYLTFNPTSVTLKNNTVETRTYVYPNIVNKNAAEYDIIYNNNFNLTVKFNNNVEGGLDNNITSIEQASNIRYFDSNRRDTTNVLYKNINEIGSSYKEYLPNYDLPSVDLSEVFVRNQTTLNKVNIASFDKLGYIYNSYIGTSFDNDDKSRLIIGSSETNINIGHTTIVGSNENIQFKKQNELELNFDTTYVANNQYIGDNIYVSNNVIHNGLDWTKYETLVDDTYVTYWTTSFIPTSRYIYEVNSYAYTYWDNVEAGVSVFMNNAGIVKLNTPYTYMSNMYPLVESDFYTYYAKPNNKLYAICTIQEQYTATDGTDLGSHDIYIGDGIYIPVLLSKLQLDNYIVTDKQILDFSKIEIKSTNMDIYTYGTYNIPLVLQSTSTLLNSDNLYMYALNSDETGKHKYETIIKDYTHRIFKGNTLNVTYWLNNKKLCVQIDECHSNKKLLNIQKINTKY